MASVPIVTSLSPKIRRDIPGGLELSHLYQSMCIDSWRQNGFDIVSVNAASEVETVRAQYPDIEIVIAERDMSELCGKPLVPIGELVRVLQGFGSRIGGIANSDVFLEPCDLAADLSLTEMHLLCLGRHEVYHPVAGGRSGHLYKYGFDAFFMNLETAVAIDLDPFTIGLPWWDYFLPVAFLRHGAEVGILHDAPLNHLAHPVQWNESYWNYMFAAFRDRFGGWFREMHDRPGAAPYLRGLIADDEAQAFFHAVAGVEAREDDIYAQAVRRYRGSYGIFVVELIMRMCRPCRYSNGSSLARGKGL